MSSKHSADSSTVEQRAIAAVRHEVRSPLLTLNMAAKLLRDDPEAVADVDLAGLVGEASQRLGRLTRDLADFTLARLGHPLRVRRSSLELEPLYRRALEELAPSLSNRPLDAHYRGAALATLDPDRFVQLLQNVLVCLQRYGSAKSPLRVDLAVSATAVQLEAEVAGPAVADEHASVLFTAGAPAVPVDALATLLIGHLVEAHGGRVSAAATGSGLRLTIELPASDDPL